MSADFDSIQSLLSQVHAEADELPDPDMQEEVEESQEDREQREEEERQEAIQSFKAECLEDPEIVKKLKKYRHEGVYAVRPWQWVTMGVGVPLLIGLAIFFAHSFSNATRANLAIQQGLTAIYGGDLTSAKTNIDEALEFGADEAGVYIQFGVALYEMEWSDSALQYYNHAVNVARTNSDYSKFVNAQLKSASIDMEEGRPVSAMTRVETVLAIDPKQRDALIDKGRLLMAEAKYDEAKDAFVAALERNNNSLTPHFYLREVYLRQNRLPDAKVHEDFLIYSRPSGDEDLPTLFGYADLLVREGRLREAEETLLKVLLNQRRVTPEIMVSLGHLSVEMQDIVKAEMYAESAVLLAPTFPDGYLIRGEIAYSRGDGSSAMRDFEKSLELDPRHGKALYDMGCLLLYDLNLYQQALSNFENAAQNGFDGPYLWYNIGAARYYLRRSESALAAFKKAPKFVTNSSEAKWSIANTLLLNNGVDTALDMYMDLRQFQERNVALENNIGVALEMSGDSTGAIRRYWAAVKLAKTPTDADPIARDNVERVILGESVGNPWEEMHTEIPLRLRGVILPKRLRKKY